jgi:hypothetical protein
VLRDHREEGTTAARCATAFSRAHQGCGHPPHHDSKEYAK